jgi:hypothetical protein
MNREKILRVRLSEEEWTKLEIYAQSKEHTISEVIRDYIKRLPRQDKGKHPAFSQGETPSCEHPRSEARNTGLRACSSGVFGIYLIS